MLMGIRWFKKFVPTSGDAVMRLAGKRHIEFCRDDPFRPVLEFEQQTRRWELRHWLGTVAFLGVAVGIDQDYTLADYGLVGVLFLLVCVYPILLQRHNRVRIVRLLRRHGDIRRRET